MPNNVDYLKKTFIFALKNNFYVKICVFPFCDSFFWCM